MKNRDSCWFVRKRKQIFSKPAIILKCWSRKDSGSRDDKSPIWAWPADHEDDDQIQARVTRISDLSCCNWLKWSKEPEVWPGAYLADFAALHQAHDLFACRALSRRVVLFYIWRNCGLDSSGSNFRPLSLLWSNIAFGLNISWQGSYKWWPFLHGSNNIVYISHMNFKNNFGRWPYASFKKLIIFKFPQSVISIVWN